VRGAVKQLLLRRRSARELHGAGDAAIVANPARELGVGPNA